MEELKKMNIRENYITVEFTKKELSEADFLMMRPKRQSIDIENEDAFRYTCEWTSRLGEKVFQHEEQVKEVVVKKVPSMKKRNAFWCESTGFSVIFADKRIRRLAEENFLSGIEFKNVFLKNGTCSDELFQMTSSNILKKECIVFGYGEKIEKCPKCGKEILEREGKSGKEFYSCSDYPTCDFSSWDMPTDKKCPKCSDMLLRKKTRNMLVCKNPKCTYKEKTDK